MDNVMVCVTKQKTCDRLIEYGEKLVDSEGSLLIIHVSKTEEKFLGNSKESEALKYLYEKAMEKSANLIVLKSDNIQDTLAGQAIENGIKKIIVGASNKEETEGEFIKKLRSKIDEDIDLIVVPS